MKTKWGNATINDKGYYRITNRSSKHYGKYLHRLIFEEFYGKIPKKCFIHHKDENPLNNCIMNLQIMTKSQHSKYHRLKYNKGAISNRKYFYRIVKDGSSYWNNKSKQRYGLFTPYPKKRIKRSVDINKLINYCEKHNLNYEVCV